MRQGAELVRANQPFAKNRSDGLGSLFIHVVRVLGIDRLTIYIQFGMESSLHPPLPGSLLYACSSFTMTFNMARFSVSPNWVGADVLGWIPDFSRSKRLEGDTTTITETMHACSGLQLAPTRW